MIKREGFEGLLLEHAYGKREIFSNIISSFDNNRIVEFIEWVVNNTGKPRFSILIRDIIEAIDKRRSK